MKKEEILKKCFTDVIWMAIRYAHGIHTYAPSMVRDAIKDFKKIYPDWKLKEDITIEPPTDLSSYASRSDYLDDLFEKKDVDIKETAKKMAEDVIKIVDDIGEKRAKIIPDGD